MPRNAPRRFDVHEHSAAQIIVRCTGAEKRLWQQAAALGRRTLSEYVRAAIEQYRQPELFARNNTVDRQRSNVRGR